MQPASRALFIAGVIVVLLAAPLAAQPPLLNSSRPGAFGVRYLTDRAVVTYTVEAPDEDAQTFTLRVRLPEKVRWGYLDREQIDSDELGWERGQAVLEVPFGSARLHLGWAGEACLPPVSAHIPVFLGDDRKAELTARFDLEGMQASGEVPEVGPGTAAVRLELAEPMDPDDFTLSVGADAVDRWRRDGPTLQARERVQIGPSPRISLRVDRRALSGSPVRRIVFEDVRSPAPVARIEDANAPEGLLVEGEDFSHVTGTPPRAEPGSHQGAHGGACIFSFLGDGTTIDWTVDIPEDGLWDLYLRISCGDVGAWRSISVDGEPVEGLELVELPGTGGWGHADAEWWIVRLTGADGLADPLELDAGEHTLSITGLLTTHLNVDYLLLAPRQ